MKVAYTKEIPKEIQPQGKAIVHKSGLIIESTIIEVNVFEITLENGRTHQIRVHLSYIGHPLIGDEIYGQKSDRINNTALICKEISFTHPKTGEKIQLEIDSPADFKSLIE